MNFNQLKYIVAVDKHRNFARAAEECDIAQSTLSKEIQRLEKAFNILIFDRSRHPVTPTMKGVDLIQQAKIIIEDQHRFIDIAKSMNNEPIGSFRLGVIPMMAPYLVPLFIQKLGAKYPKLNVEIAELTPSEMLKEFEEDLLDGAISISPFVKDGFYENRLFEEDFVLYMDELHPLATHDKIKWEAVLSEKLTLQEAFKSYVFPENKNDQFTILNNVGNINYQSGSLETIRKIIDRNGGLTLLPKLSCIYMGKRRLNMVRQIIDPSLHRDIAFISPRGFEKNRITKVIKEEIKNGILRVTDEVNAI